MNKQNDKKTTGNGWAGARRIVMADLETLGREKGSVVTEVAAVYYDLERGIVEASFKWRLPINEQINRGLKVDEKTLKWRLEKGWNRAVIDEDGEVTYTDSHGDSLESFFDNLQFFFNHVKEQFNKGEELEIWAQGYDFEQNLLAGLVEACAVVANQINYWQWRDLRTLCKVLGVKREGEVVHEAMADAVQQARALKRCFDLVEENDQEHSVEKIEVGDLVVVQRAGDRKPWLAEVKTVRGEVLEVMKAEYDMMVDYERVFLAEVRLVPRDSALDSLG